MRPPFRYLPLILLLAVGACLADEQEQLLLRVAERLSVAQELSGRFHQEKYVSFLQKPFVSKGEFSLSRTGGLRWQVTEPVDSLMSVQGDVVTLDGQPVQDYGVARLMTRLMFAFMEGDVSGLDRAFDVQAKVDDEGWQLSLIPNGARLQAAFERIDMLGDDHLREVTVLEQEGSRTRVRFLDVRATGPTAPQPEAFAPDETTD